MPADTGGRLGNRGHRVGAPQSPFLPAGRRPGGSGSPAPDAGLKSPSSFLLVVLSLRLVPQFGAATTPNSGHGGAAAGSEGFTIDLTASEADVLKAVQGVVKDQVIHGTYVYEREQTLTGAVEQTSSSYFGDWGARATSSTKFEGTRSPPTFQEQHGYWRDYRAIRGAGVLENRTHLVITAVFVEDGTKHLHVRHNGRDQ